jgi:hypothetical protein
MYSTVRDRSDHQSTNHINHQQPVNVLAHILLIVKLPIIQPFPPQQKTTTTMTTTPAFPYTCELDVTFPTDESAIQTKEVMEVDDEVGNRVVKTLEILDEDSKIMRV